MSTADTIVAVATPPGAGGVGIVRLSGADAPRILSALFAPKKTPEAFPSHQLVHGRIADPQSGEVVDEVLAVRMHAPHSYTGEEVVEIHGHGSPALLARIVSLAIAQGVRAARPGEFTERAFLNERIDLAQAEAVADLIGARTEEAQRQALELLRGTLSKKVQALTERIRRALAHVEVNIDFVEDDAGAPDFSEIEKNLTEVSAELGELLAGYRRGRILREGARVALVGAPNAGKSSLFNALLSEERALVHHEPGTTRDRLEEWCDLEGLPVRLVDTAGLREAGGVEGAGVALARKAIEEADLLLLVADGSAPVPPESAALAKNEVARVLAVANKMDLSGARCPEGFLPISVKSGEGFGALRAELSRRLAGGVGSGEGGGVLLTRERHRSAVAGAQAALAKALPLLRAGDNPELAASVLREALAQLAEISGETTSDDVLGLIFSEFCIGK